MKIAVITPYYKESTEVLRQCYESVINQDISTNYVVDHLFVADGFPNEEIMKWNIKHTTLSNAHGDFGDTPRGIASMIADVEGYDFIAYLDADNWYYPNHLSSLLHLHQKTKADVCTSFRSFYTIGGINMAIKENDEESLSHVDTSCYLLSRNSFDALNIWLKMPHYLHALGDRVFYSGLKKQKIYNCFNKGKNCRLPHSI